jgi:hypothetical protein
MPDPDQLTVARLTGAAQRHAPWREPTEAETATAVEELREIAGDRGDLLAEVAGLLIGFYRGTIEELKAQAAAQYCIAAGADPDLIPHWIEVRRCRAAVARQTPYTGPRGDDLGDVRLNTVRTGLNPVRIRHVSEDAGHLFTRMLP